MIKRASRFLNPKHVKVIMVYYLIYLLIENEMINFVSSRVKKMWILAVKMIPTQTCGFCA
jgi:hypothetical protein